MDGRLGDVTVALATCRALPTGDDDAELLVSALARQHMRAEWHAWDDPSVVWSQFALTVIRSTWDYTAHRAAYLRWAAALPRLHNPAPVLAWNSDKSYLREVGEAALPTVPTQWIEPGESLQWLPDTEFVLKPSVGAGSKGAGRFDPADPATAGAAASHIADLHAAGRTVMVQPYLADVDTVGEAALLYFDGVFSHSITKRAMLAPATVNPVEIGYSGSLFVPEMITPRVVTAAERDLGDRVLAYLSARFTTPLYARVDLLPTADGPVIIELELTEPSLFLSHDPAGADRIAAAIAMRLG